MNEAFVIDAYAWIEYLDGSARGTFVRNIIENANNKIYTCAVTVAEVVSKFIRRGYDPETAFSAITTNSTIIKADENLSKTAGETHAKIKSQIRDFGLADAYVLACALKHRTKVLTGDPHFKGIPEVVTV